MNRNPSPVSAYIFSYLLCFLQVEMGNLSRRRESVLQKSLKKNEKVEAKWGSLEDTLKESSVLWGLSSCLCDVEQLYTHSNPTSISVYFFCIFWRKNKSIKNVSPYYFICATFPTDLLSIILDGKLYILTSNDY